ETSPFLSCTDWLGTSFSDGAVAHQVLRCCGSASQSEPGDQLCNGVWHRNRISKQFGAQARTMSLGACAIIQTSFPPPSGVRKPVRYSLLVDTGGFLCLRIVFCDQSWLAYLFSLVS